MGFMITDEMAQEIKEYCTYHEYNEDDEYHRINCKYCAFDGKKGCRLHNEKMGFPSDWNV